MVVQRNGSRVLDQRSPVRSLPNASWSWIDSLVCHGLALLLLILLITPPNGILSHNEEYYLAEALRSVLPEFFGSHSAFFDGAWHRAAFEIPVGIVVQAFGFEMAQASGRVVVALLYASSLTLLFRHLGVGTIGTLLIISVFYLLDQNILGGEWLLGGLEAKTVAYPLLFFGFWSALKKRYVWAFVVLGGATYFHFLVGGFWFLVMGVGQLWYGRNVKKTLAGAALYLFMCFPLIWVVVADNTGVVGVAAGVPSADWIYANFRHPHHVAPFSSLPILKSWLPRIGLLAVLTMAVAGLWFTGTRRERRLAAAIGLLCVYLVCALGLAYMDRNTGVLGKFYLFRPSSVTLLAFLSLVAIYLRDRVGSGYMKQLEVATLVVLAALFLPEVVDTHWRRHGSSAESRKELEGLITSDLQADDVVLIEPRIENSWLDFERTFNRPTLVMWKFVPSRGRDIAKWYRLIMIRRRVFEEGCRELPEIRLDYLLSSSATARMLDRSCGVVAFLGNDMALISIR